MITIGKRFYFLITAFIFVGVGLLHGYRAFNGIPLVYGDYLVPVWVSTLAVLVAFLLALAAVKHLR